MAIDLGAGLPGARDVRGIRWDVRALDPCEREELFDWLDDGLRGGRRGRLASEYGAVLDAAGTTHVTARLRGRLACHAMTRVVDALAPGQSARLGLIGLVYTAPELRRRGLAGRCLERAATQLRSRGAALAALWSDRHDFYAQYGFRPAGRERWLQLDRGTCAQAGALASKDERVRPPDDADWDVIERLYAAKPARVARARGLLRSLAAAPDCLVRVAGPVGGPKAYTACGRGDDFAGVVHEWAGDPGGVLACLRASIPEGGSIGMIAGPWDEPPIAALCRAGAQVHEGCLALVRPLTADAASLPLDQLFLWGFDSI